MSEPAGARIPAGVLVWVTVGALALGGSWWVHNPPVHHPPAGSGSRASEPLARPVMPGQARDLRAEVTEPEPEPGPPRLLLPVERDGSAPVWSVGEDPEGVRYLDDERAAEILPPAENVALQQGVLLGPGDTVVHDGPAPTSGGHLLEVVCHGAGEFVVEVTLPDRDASQHRHECGGTVLAIELSYQPGYAAIHLSAPDSNHVSVLVAYQVTRG